MQNEIFSDERIIRQILDGNVEKFRVIIERYQAHIYSIGMRFFKNNDDANDFVQDVFIKVYNELGTFKGKAQFRSWLIKIAYNFGINKINARKIDNVVFEESVSGWPTPEQDHIKDETINLLRNAVNTLPEQYRICVDLYFYMGMKYSEIEGVTGYPVNTIKSNVLRAKHILRDRLRGSIAEDYHEM